MTLSQSKCVLYRSNEIRHHIEPIRYYVLSGYTHHYNVYKIFSNCILPIVLDMMLTIVIIMILLGYRLSPQALNVMVKRYSLNNRISFDDFVACCVRLRALTGKKRRDIARKKIIFILIKLT